MITTSFIFAQTAMYGVSSPFKGRFAQLLEQNPNFLDLPCVRSRYVVARLSKYDFWIPDNISHRYGCPDVVLTPFEL